MRFYLLSLFLIIGISAYGNTHFEDKFVGKQIKLNGNCSVGNIKPHNLVTLIDAIVKVEYVVSMDNNEPPVLIVKELNKTTSLYCDTTQVSYKIN